MILLTKEEISEVLIRQVREDGKYIEDRQYEYLNKALLKKVVEWMWNECYGNPDVLGYMRLEKKEWQALLKECE